MHNNIVAKYEWSRHTNDLSFTTFAQLKQKLMNFFSKLPSELQNRSSLEIGSVLEVGIPIQRVDSAITYWFNLNSPLKSIALRNPNSTFRFTYYYY